MGAVRDAHDKNNWKWLNGDDVTVSFWSVSSSGSEITTAINGGDCARFDGAKGWLWSDTNCNSPLNFICQHRTYSLICNNLLCTEGQNTIRFYLL